MTEEIKIKIKNFEKYNPRNDVKNASWIRFEIGFFENSAFFNLTLEEKMAWVYILCYAAKADDRELFVSYDHFARLTAAKPEVLFRTIKKLELNQLIEVVTLRPRNASDTPMYATERDDTRREETNKNLSTDSRQVVQSQPVVSKATPATIDSPKVLISKIPRVTIERWALLYNDEEFLQRETLKAMTYYESNPRKTPKTVRGWTQALSSWFARAWDWRAKNTPGKKPVTKVDIDSILKGFDNGNDQSSF